MNIKDNLVVWWRSVVSPMAQPGVNMHALNAALTRATELTYPELIALAHNATSNDHAAAIQKLSEVNKAKRAIAAQHRQARKEVVEAAVDRNLIKGQLANAGLTPATAKKLAKKKTPKVADS